MKTYVKIPHKTVLRMVKTSEAGETGARTFTRLGDYTSEIVLSEMQEIEC